MILLTLILIFSIVEGGLERKENWNEVCLPFSFNMGEYVKIIFSSDISFVFPFVFIIIITASINWDYGIKLVKDSV